MIDVILEHKETVEKINPSWYTQPLAHSETKIQFCSFNLSIVETVAASGTLCSDYRKKKIAES